MLYLQGKTRQCGGAAQIKAARDKVKNVPLKWLEGWKVLKIIVGMRILQIYVIGVIGGDLIFYKYS